MQHENRRFCLAARCTRLHYISKERKEQWTERWLRQWSQEGPGAEVGCYREKRQAVRWSLKKGVAATYSWAVFFCFLHVQKEVPNTTRLVFKFSYLLLDQSLKLLCDCVSYFPVSYFVNFRKMNFYKTIYLSEYIEAKLPRHFESINYKSDDIHSSILPDINGNEIDLNSVSPLPELPIKRAQFPSQRVKVTNRYSGYSNNHAL